MAPLPHAIVRFLVTVALFSLICNISGNAVEGNIDCEELPIEDCAFAVASSGARCVLEKEVHSDGTPVYKCQTSIIMAERPVEWIETDECISTCGLQRLSVGLSTDALLEKEFTKKLCFSECRTKCPNIDDLYTKLAAGEGMYLPSLCDSLKPRTRRLISSQSKAANKIKPSSKEELVDAVPSQPTIALKLATPVASPIASPSPSPITYGVAEEPYPAMEPPIEPPSPTEAPAMSPSNAPSVSPSYAPYY